MKITGERHRMAVHNCDLSGSVFDDVNLSGCTYENVNMSGGKYHNINLSGCVSTRRTSRAPRSSTAGSTA